MSTQKVSLGHGSGQPAANDPEKIHQCPLGSAWEENERKKATLKDIVTEYGEGGTAHGIPRIITSERWWAKLFWLIISCGFAAVFGYQGVGLMFDYFSYPYTTNIDVISKTKVEFPAVTICNMNRMRRSELVGTRYQELVDIDGGFNVDGDYAWFYDFSSAFYDDWYSEWEWEEETNSTADPNSDPTSPAAGSDPTPTDLGAEPGSSTNNTRRKRDTGSTSYDDISQADVYEDVYAGLVSAYEDQYLQERGVERERESEDVYAGLASAYEDQYQQEWDVEGESEDMYAGLASAYEDRYQQEWDVKGESEDMYSRLVSAYPGLVSAYEDLYQPEWDVEGESDWQGFYEQSRAPDFSDIVEVVNPTREELEEFGHQAEDFILQCTFDKRECNYTDFRQFQNNHYGNCYTFNHGFNNDKVRKTSKSGAQYGLHLTLFIEQPEYVGLFSTETGVRVSVHSANVQPSPEDIGITAATGMSTSIGIRQSKIDRLGGLYTKPPCTEDGSETAYSHPEYAYSALACRRACLQGAFKDECGCVTDVSLEGEQKCSVLNYTQKFCKTLTEILYNKGYIECACPDICHELIYPTSVSNALWPSDRYEEHLYHRLSEHNEKVKRTLLNVETTRKNLVRLRIYYEELNYQIIQQQKSWTIESISGAVGGLMGLYLGISAVSILEILIFLLKVLIYIFTFGHFGVNRVQPM